MSAYVSPYGLDGEARLNFDSLGKFYTAIAIIWTSIVVCASGFLLLNRHLPALRVRNTHLWTSAVVFLHAYWIICLHCYLLNGTYPCAAEYWVMSTWLPLGIALYQVNGMHLLHVVSLQTRFVVPQASYTYQGSKSGRSGWRRMREIASPDSLSRLQRICITGGVILQFLVTLVIYLVSRKFHPSWGLVGHAVDSIHCRRDWEWIPSIVWQFFWAWVYAPYLLWKVRNIHDLHGWRLQTTVCCVAGLLGSPMWLLSLYSPYFSPGLANASKYFVPALWFTPGILAMEISIIFIPCIMVVKSRRLQRETLQQLLDWERNKASGTSVDTGSTYVQGSDDFMLPTPDASKGAIRNDLYSMAALEKALATNITPLLRFSALKDFSGENISFLKHVQDWKVNWSRASSQPAPAALRFSLNKKAHNPPSTFDTEAVRRHQFALAVEIYVTFVSPQYSDFPINISYAQLKELDSVFSSAASTLDARIQENSATPFDSFAPPEDDVEHRGADKETNINITRIDDDTPTRRREQDAISVASTVVPINRGGSKDNKQPHNSASSMTTSDPSSLATFSLLELKPRLDSDVTVPLVFGPGVFDGAERAVKYAVLTNTWPKFVSAGYATKGERERERERELDKKKAFGDCIATGGQREKGYAAGARGGWGWNWMTRLRSGR